jgi:hypothetical protein
VPFFGTAGQLTQDAVIFIFLKYYSCLRGEEKNPHKKSGAKRSRDLFIWKYHLAFYQNPRNVVFLTRGVSF